MDAFIFWFFVVALIVFTAKRYSDLIEFVRKNHPDELENIQGFGYGIWYYWISGSNKHVQEKVNQYMISIAVFFGGGVLVVGLISNIVHGLKN
jgi:hypothetical protein